MRFKPQDFEGCWHGLKATTYQDVAKRANELFMKWLQSQAFIYGNESDQRLWVLPDVTNIIDPRTCDRQARIVHVEPRDLFPDELVETTAKAERRRK